MLHATTLHGKIQKTLRSFVPALPENEGICHGFSLMWLQAAMTSKEALQQFYDRVRYAALSENTQNEVEGILKDYLRSKKRNSDDRPTESDIMIIEMRAFFECMAIYQAPDLFDDFFNETVYQTEINKTFLLAQNQRLESSEPLTFCTIGPLHVTKDELSEYLLNLEKAILSKDKVDDRIGFLLSSENHSIGIYYDAEIQKWAFLNINHLKIQVNWHQTMNHVELSERIYSSFKLISSSQEVTLNAKAILNLNQMKLLDDFIDIRDKYFEKIYHHQNIENLLFLAVYDNQLDIVKKILTHAAVDINYINPSEGVTPLWVACEQRNLEIVQCMLGHREIDIYITDSFGNTALDIARRNNDLDIIALFDKFTGVRLKRKMVTP